MKIYYYIHDESDVAWESLLPPEIECQDTVIEVDSARFKAALAMGYTVTRLSDVLKMFAKFMADKDAWDMYITGMAGTGKTYSLKEIVEICAVLGITFHICTHTHQACSVLRGYLPNFAANISTTHSFLNKRPIIDEDADHVDKLNRNIKCGATKFRPQLLFIDELGVVGEKDLMDLRVLQDPDYDGEVTTKIVWLGDPNQTLPVKDIQAVIPEKPYWVKLIEIKRNSTLHEPLKQLVSFIEGKKPEPLITNEYFVRGKKDLVQEYLDCSHQDKIMLAFTNEQVQNLNFQIAGRELPEPGDILYSGTVNKTFLFLNEISPIDIVTVDRYYDSPLTFGSKYKTLEFLLQTNLCRFFKVTDEEGEVKIFPVIFGTYNFKRLKEELGRQATNANNEIIKEYKVQNPAQWAKINWNTPLARKRALAWRTFLTLDDTILCMDFNYARTVHKAQGSSYQYVFLDTDNLAIARDSSYENYLRLLYTGISRSREYVITN
jgi:hypothetical protein